MTREETSPISKANAEHYLWGTRCDGWHLVKNPNLSVIQERMPAGASEVRHFHHRSQQFFYMLSGEAAMEVQGRVFILTLATAFGSSPAHRTK